MYIYIYTVDVYPPVCSVFAPGNVRGSPLSREHVPQWENCASSLGADAQAPGQFHRVQRKDLSFLATQVAPWAISAGLSEVQSGGENGIIFTIYLQSISQLEIAFFVFTGDGPSRTLARTSCSPGMILPTKIPR